MNTAFDYYNATKKPGSVPGGGRSREARYATKSIIDTIKLLFDLI